MTALIAIRGSAASGGTFDYYLSPTGDDARGNGSLTSPWSLTAFINGATINGVSNTPLPGGKRYGMLPGTYQNGFLNGVATSLYSLFNGITLPNGTSANYTFLGSSDIHGNYSPRTATLDLSLPGTAATFTASIAPDTTNGGGILTVTAMTSGTITPALSYLTAGGLTPTWIDNQRTSTAPGGALGGTGTYGVSPWGDTVASQTMTSVLVSPGRSPIFSVVGNGTLTPTNSGTIPTTGYVTVAGLNFKHCGYASVYLNKAIGLNVYDCDIGPCRFFTKQSNPAAVHINFSEGPINVYNNKIHDCTTLPPFSLPIADSICNGTTVSGLPVAGQMWTGGDFATPWPFASTPFDAPVNWVMDNGQSFKAGLGTGGLICNYGSTSFTVGVDAKISAATAPVNGASYSGGTFTGIQGSANWVFPTATNYALQLIGNNLAVMQTIPITCTAGSPNFTVTGGPVTINVTGAIFGTWVLGVQITTAPTVLGLDTSDGFAPWGYRPYQQIPAGANTTSVNIYNNSIYNTAGAELVKDMYFQNWHFTYNYMEPGRKGSQPGVFFMGMGSGGEGFTTQGADAGRTCDFNHNIVWGGVGATADVQAGDDNSGTVNFLNNTIIGGTYQFALNDGTKSNYTLVVEPQTGVYNIHNNVMWNSPSQYLVIKNGGTGSGWLGGMASSSFIDYNCYPSGAKFGIGPTPNVPLTGTTYQGLSVWQTPSGYTGAPTTPPFPGYDIHSTTLTASPFFGTGGDGVPVGAVNTTTGVANVAAAIASCALNGTTPANTAGQGGVQCGAVDGTTGPSGNTVGCNF